MKFISNFNLNILNKLSIPTILLIFIVLLLMLVLLFKKTNSSLTEGYQQNDQFLFKQGDEIYDDFYSDVYDYLVFNNLKDDYEIGAIINRTNPTTKSVILDIGSGTGHHVAKLAEKGLNVVGIDISPAMIKKAKENYPQYRFINGSVLNSSQFMFSSFTHILCLYFTIYYFQDKSLFFQNCMEWLMPGGYLIVHLVDKEHFDPILPAGNPLYIVSPQKYAKERITKTKVVFDKFNYESQFHMDDPNTSVTIFSEKFKFKNGKSRTQEHHFYMDPHEDILNMATDIGFLLYGKIDLVKCAYESQYLYILVKPE